MTGLMMFAKYAFPPNLLQLCGPSENKEFFEILNRKNSGEELKNLLLQFEGAVPYLRLIAESNGIKDFFDARVVEAYWIGNDLLKNVKAGDIYSNVKERFKKEMALESWSWLVSKSVPQAKPFHGFHVFDIYRRVGLLRSGKVKDFLETMDKCRIGWGKVESTELVSENKNSFGIALVNYAPLEFYEGKLRIGKNKIKKFFLLTSFIKKGDGVSLHWDYICDKINPQQKMNLVYWTDYHLKLTNQTI